MKRQQRIHRFVETIWDWYSRNKRALSWRDLWNLSENDRAYRVLVSEIMLQQTQVSRVKIVFNDFIDQFRTVEDLAKASNRDVLLAWRGMGYNSRALRLRDAARTIVARCSLARFSIDAQTTNKQQANKLTSNGFPRSMEDLTAIPGIGNYTAAAIRNFAFNLPTPCLDTNIRRILHRTFVGPENPDGSWSKDDQYLLKLAGEALQVACQTFDAANWHAALMDFGSLIQTKSNPKWEICPLTAKGLMKAKSKHYKIEQRATSNKQRIATEPGRNVAGKFVPNRIFRGKIVEILRDMPEGVTLEKIGREVCIDWDESQLRMWIDDILKKLMVDQLIEKRGRKFLLKG